MEHGFQKLNTFTKNFYLKFIDELYNISVFGIVENQNLVICGRKFFIKLYESSILSIYVYVCLSISIFYRLLKH